MAGGIRRITYDFSIHSLQVTLRSPRHLPDLRAHAADEVFPHDSTPSPILPLVPRLAASGGYVAQKWVPKSSMEIDGTLLWTDLRVWAYRGKVFHLSGRASRRPDRLDLTPPGGWLPTYAAASTPIPG
jgi:hypothetical protein